MQAGQAGILAAELVAATQGATDFEEYLALEALIGTGNLTAAKQFVFTNETRRNDFYLITEYHLQLAVSQAANDDLPAAAENLRLATDSSSKWKRNSLIPRLQWLDRIIRTWVRIGRQADAFAVYKVAHNLILAKESKASARDIPLAWGILAKLRLVVPEAPAVQTELREAIQNYHASISRQIAGMPENPDSQFQSHAINLGRLAMDQFVAGFVDDANTTSHLAIETMKQVQSEMARHSGLFNLIELQCDAGDVSTAIQATQLMILPYWKAKACCSCSSRFMKLQQEAEARRYLESALSFIEQESDLRSKLSVLVESAELLAQWGELSVAKDRFQKLLQLSGDDEDNGVVFQTVALAQIRIGLIDDAYGTVHRIVDPQWRTAPLIKLAHQSAKQQAERRKLPVEM